MFFMFEERQQCKQCWLEVAVSSPLALRQPNTEPNSRERSRPDDDGRWGGVEDQH